jgi:hypothetical protein
MATEGTAKECCAMCRYARRAETGNSIEIRCRRYAPAPMLTIRAKAHWVYVAPDDWCGEYQPQPG